MNIIQGILRAATRQPGDKLNILLFPGDESYDAGLCETGHNFFGVRPKGWGPWDNSVVPIPNNYCELKCQDDGVEIPLWIDIDLIISQQKPAQISMAKNLASQFGVPIVSVEHNIKPSGQYLSVRGNLNVIDSECQRADPSDILNMIGIDRNIFCDYEKVERNNTLWYNHNKSSDFDVMRRITGFPLPMMGMKVIESQNIYSKEELVDNYRGATVYLNTDRKNPIPRQMLEAMACECPIVSINSGDIKKFIINGENGFVADSPEELRDWCFRLTQDRPLATKIGKAGRATVIQHFNKYRFVEAWTDIISLTISRKV